MEEGQRAVFRIATQLAKETLDIVGVNCLMDESIENGSIVVDVIVDDKMEGNITKLSDFKSAKDVYSLFGDSRYKIATVRKA